MNVSAFPKRTGGLLFLTFNQDHSCFACGTDEGFFICNSDPLKERFRRDFASGNGGIDGNGGIGIVEMLFKCNILALVGGGAHPKYPPKKVMIWDDYQSKCIAELEFRTPVKAVKLRRDRIVVVLENKVYVYNFADLQLLEQIETCKNEKGLCALSPGQTQHDDKMVLAVPGLKPGSVHVELYSSGTSNTINAHNTALACIALSVDGSLLATASEKGTLVRIWNTATGEKVKELRRGADKAEIYSLSFNPNASAICVCSDKGTAHIYTLPPRDTGHEESTKKNKQSSLSFMKDVLPSYFSSEWSMASFSVPNKSICAFGPTPGSIIVISGDGTYSKHVYDPEKGGDCKRQIFRSFLKSD